MISTNMRVNITEIRIFFAAILSLSFLLYVIIESLCGTPEKYSVDIGVFWQIWDGIYEKCRHLADLEVGFC